MFDVFARPVFIPPVVAISSLNRGIAHLHSLALPSKASVQQVRVSGWENIQPSHIVPFRGMTSQRDIFNTHQHAYLISLTKNTWRKNDFVNRL